MEHIALFGGYTILIRRVSTFNKKGTVPLFVYPLPLRSNPKRLLFVHTDCAEREAVNHGGDLIRGWYTIGRICLLALVSSEITRLTSQRDTTTTRHKRDRSKNQINRGVIPMIGPFAQPRPNRQTSQDAESVILRESMAGYSSSHQSAGGDAITISPSAAAAVEEERNQVIHIPQLYVPCFFAESKCGRHYVHSI